MSNARKSKDVAKQKQERTTAQAKNNIKQLKQVSKEPQLKQQQVQWQTIRGIKNAMVLVLLLRR